MDINTKKIAVLCNYELLPERIGGMDHFFWSFDKKCKENSIHIDWFFPNISSHGDYFKLTIKESRCQNVETYFLKYCQNKELGYTHIITHFVELCTPFFYKIKQICNTRIIAIDHNPRPLKGYSFKKLVEKKVKGKLFSRYIDVFVGVSNYSENQLIKEFGKQISKKSIVVYNGLEIEKFKKKTKFDLKKSFIVASHLRKDKGIQDLIVAVKDLDTQLKVGLEIDIYGKGYFEAELKSAINEFSLERIFRFKGSVSNLNEIYCDYDYLIHPSHGETFCYSVVESLLSNLPVITTRNQGNVLGLIQENKNGFLFEAGKTDELTLVLENVLSHEYHVDVFSMENTKLNSFSLGKMVDHHFTLIV